MNKSLKSSEVEIEAQEQNPPSAKWGRRLREERESRDLSVEDISAELRLETYLIQQIEDEDVDKLPSAPFVKGYLRSYARLLDLDETRIIDAYSQLDIEDAPGIKKLNQVSETNSQHAGARVATWGVIVVVVVSVVAWLWSQMTSPSMREESSVPVIEQPKDIASGFSSISTHVVIDTPAPTTPENQDVETLETSVPVEIVDVPSTAIATESLAEEPEQTEVGLSASEGLVAIGLSFSAESWVEITDARGERLFVNIGKPDSDRKVEGVPPFSVLLGNAPAVKIVYDGKPYDHVRHNRKGIARFTLGETVSE